MFKGLNRKSKAEKTLYIAVSILFGAVALSYLYILFWMFFSAMKDHNSIVMEPFALPTQWHWDHLIEVIDTLEVNGKGFLSMLFNSLWFSIVPVVINQLTTAAFAYACTKYTFPTSKLGYGLTMILLALPIYGTGGAAYALRYQMGLTNNYLEALFNIGGCGLHFLYYRAYFTNMSWTYAEAAQMDGANDFQIYYKVMLPQTKPLLTALALTAWIAQWNSYSHQMIYHPQLPTLPLGIYQFNTEMIYRARLDILFAGCFLACIPTLILFIAFNKVITTSVSLGGIKG